MRSILAACCLLGLRLATAPAAPTTQVVRFSMDLSSDTVCRASRSTQTLVATILTNLHPSDARDVLGREYSLCMFSTLASDTTAPIARMELGGEDAFLPTEDADLFEEVIVRPSEDGSAIEIDFEKRVEDLDFTFANVSQHFFVGAGVAPVEGEWISSAILKVKNATLNDIWRKRSIARWNLRIDRPGTFEIRLCRPGHGCAGVRERFFVSDCVAEYDAAHADTSTYVAAEDESYAVSTTNAFDNDDDETEATPFYSLERVVPFDGSRGVRVPPGAVNVTTDTWTLSFWLYLPASSATSPDFQGLFYKGPDEVQRTPSAWILPNSTRVIFKVSTAEDPDVGGPSRGELPTDRWTHLAFTFEPRRATMYVNGVLDVRYELAVPILANDGPMYVGKDPWLPGLRGLLARIEMREGARVRVPGSAAASTLAKIYRGDDDADDPLASAAAAFLEEDDDRFLSALLTAAMRGSTGAHLGVASYYYRQDADDCEAYLAGYRNAAEEAVDLFHRTGQEPIVEIHRLSSPYAPAVRGRGERGLDDPEIQFQLDQANSGHVPSMVAMASLFYYGARGVPRDQYRAFDLFARAAAERNTEAECAMGNLLIKGEGCERNATAAVEWYRLAAAKNHSGALNGLGYASWNGDGGLAKNRTAALDYFSRAAREGAGADAWFNAGYIHDVEGRIDEAETWWTQAAARFGHIDAVVEMGRMHADDRRGTWRDNPARCVAASTYYRAAVDVGPWRGRTARSGYDAFLEGDDAGALDAYLRAGVAGCDAAVENAAYVLDRRLGRKREAARLYRGVTGGGAEAELRAGELAAEGWGESGVRNWTEAARRFERAGNARAALWLAGMRERGDGVPRNRTEAMRLYDVAIERSGDDAVGLGVWVSAWLGKMRLSLFG